MAETSTAWIMKLADGKVIDGTAYEHGRRGCSGQAAPRRMVPAVSANEGVQQRADIHKKSQPERDDHRKVLCAIRTGQVPVPVVPARSKFSLPATRRWTSASTGRPGQPEGFAGERAGT
jgi:hypothetical protein